MSLFQIPMGLLGERIEELTVIAAGTMGLAGGFLILSRVYTFPLILLSLLFAKGTSGGQHSLGASALSMVFEVSGRRAVLCHHSRIVCDRSFGLWRRDRFIGSHFYYGDGCVVRPSDPPLESFPRGQVGWMPRLPAAGAGREADPSRKPRPLPACAKPLR